MVSTLHVERVVSSRDVTSQVEFGRKWMFSVSANVTSRSFVWAGGCTVLAKDVSESHAFGIEFLASFLVVFVVFSCYEKTKYDQYSQTAPFVIGLVYATTIMVAVSIS